MPPPTQPSARGAWAWPQQAEQVQQELVHAGGTVLYLLHPPHTPRTGARAAVRQALVHSLAAWRACTPAEVQLDTPPGQRPRAWAQGVPVHVSFSHDEGLSLLAVHTQGPVGVDAMAQEQAPAWAQDGLPMARDYLGPALCAALAALPPAARTAALARAWVRHEAALKCLGRGITEYSASTAAAVARVAVRELVLPTGYLGAIALAHPM